MQVYSLSEVAAKEGLTRNGVLWLVKKHNIECCKTESNRRFFTDVQLEQFRVFTTKRGISKKTNTRQK